MLLGFQSQTTTIFPISVSIFKHILLAGKYGIPLKQQD